MKAIAEVRFQKLRPGRIHARCPECGRPQSNMKREDYDPPDALFIELFCENCGHGMKDCEPRYFGADGKEVCEL